MEKITEKLRKNPFILATVVLGIVCLYLLYGLMTNYEETKQDLSAVQPTANEYFCAKINSTPSWGDINGNIIDQGYKSFGNQSWDVVGELLIPNQIFFIYNLDCGWCQQQIEYFGTSWEEYSKSGYVIDCSI